MAFKLAKFNDFFTFKTYLGEEDIRFHAGNINTIEATLQGIDDLPGNYEDVKLAAEYVILDLMTVCELIISKRLGVKILSLSLREIKFFHQANIGDALSICFEIENEMVEKDPEEITGSILVYNQDGKIIAMATPTIVWEKGLKDS